MFTRHLARRLLQTREGENVTSEVGVSDYVLKQVSVRKTPKEPQRGAGIWRRPWWICRQESGAPGITRVVPVSLCRRVSPRVQGRVVAGR